MLVRKAHIVLVILVRTVLTITSIPLITTESKLIQIIAIHGPGKLVRRNRIARGTKSIESSLPTSLSRNKVRLAAVALVFEV